ncbi:hypothetical protein [Hydrogenimonas sp. SS33]|uniref:hypothetical protein n=1 Tax=Hydrogenimonas leucolamina TaxID=2954236 RepID=UPI00336BEAA9
MKRIIQIVLLMALFVNAAHAYFIVAEEHCTHETVHEYVVEMEHGSQCGDLCDLHHMFHLQAIPVTPAVVLPRLSRQPELPEYKEHYQPHLDEPSYRPPITL